MVGNTLRSGGPPSGPERPSIEVPPSDGGHHVHQHPRPTRRRWPVDLRVGTVDRDVVGRLGEQHPHGSGPYRRGTMPAVETRTAFRTCPLCEAGCGLEITLKDEARLAHPRRPGRRLQPRVHLPQGLDPEAAARGPRPPAHARWSSATARSSRRPGTRRSPRSSGACRRSSTRTAATRWPSTSATRTPTTWPACSTPARSSGRSARRTSTRPAPSTSGRRSCRPG